MTGEIDFKSPVYLLLLIPWTAALIFYLKNKIFMRGAAFSVSSASALKGSIGVRARTYPYLPALRFIAALLLIIAAASPGKSTTLQSLKSSGIDIMITLDLSGSMQAEDFQPGNRLTAAVNVINDFISMRESDRLGLAIFAGEAYLQCPLTLEHNLLTEIVNEVDFDNVRKDGTAIGDAIALAAANLDKSDAKSRTILLLTDGANNRGVIDPVTAAHAAEALEIKIYTIGIGTEGEVTIPTPRGPARLKDHYDEKLLREISSMTEGRFFHAESKQMLDDVMREIDRLEKSEIEIQKYHSFSATSIPIAAAAVIIFFAEILARSLFYRKVP